MVAFLDLIDKYQLDPELKKWGNNVWHGMVGIYKIQEDLGVTDKEILRKARVFACHCDDFFVVKRNAQRIGKQSADKSSATSVLS